MDFQQAENITATQAIGDDTDYPECGIPPLPPPLSAEHAALRSNFEIITKTTMAQFYSQITADIQKSATDTTIALRKSNDELRNQVSLLGTQVTQLQQQILTYEKASELSQAKPATAPPKKDPRKKREKPSTNPTAATNTSINNPTYAAVATTAMAAPTALTTHNNKSWTTLKVGGQKDRKSMMPKLIPTIYPPTEREVTCYFNSDNQPDTTHMERDHVVRQVAVDKALRSVNSAIVNNKDVRAPPFISARVTVRGNVIFTTGNTQNNIIYKDYMTIIADTLSYYGQCEKVEIGKCFSQFLLHGVPTHLSLPKISHSLAANYPQLIQGQTPRWLTPANQWEHKANSTIVIRLTVNVKKANIGRQNLVVCKHEYQLDDYIAYGWSTQCHNCQTYGHPAALCRNDPRGDVCAGSHPTKEHSCSLPICKKGPTCTHPPIHYVSCNTPHKPSDPNCPERIKLHKITKANTNTTNQGDAPIAVVII